MSTPKPTPKTTQGNGSDIDSIYVGGKFTQDFIEYCTKVEFSDENPRFIQAINELEIMYANNNFEKFYSAAKKIFDEIEDINLNSKNKTAIKESTPSNWNNTDPVHAQKIIEALQAGKEEIIRMLKADTIPRYIAKQAAQPKATVVTPKIPASEIVHPKVTTAEPKMNFLETVLNKFKELIVKLIKKESLPVIKTLPKVDEQLILNNNADLQHEIKEILDQHKADQQNGYTSTSGAHQRNMEALVAKALERLVLDPKERDRIAEKYVESKFHASQNPLQERFANVVNNTKNLSQNNVSQDRSTSLTTVADGAAISGYQITSSPKTRVPVAEIRVEEPHTKFKC
jgi:hypothetical protein